MLWTMRKFVRRTRNLVLTIFAVGYLEDEFNYWRLSCTIAAFETKRRGPWKGLVAIASVSGRNFTTVGQKSKRFCCWEIPICLIFSSRRRQSFVSASRRRLAGDSWVSISKTSNG
jgi:hypothetical protein